jgi:hypothetical protein
MSWPIALVLFLACAPLLLALRRASELARFVVRGGVVTRAKGHVPARMLADVGDVVKRPNVAHALVRIVVDGGAPRVLVTGSLTSAQVQQLRNVVGGYPLAKLRSTPRRR